MDHYSICLDHDDPLVAEIDRGINDLIRQTSCRELFKYKISGDPRSIRAGVFGMENKILEIEQQGVIIMSMPLILEEYARAIYLCGFDQSNENYNQWQTGLEQIGLTHHEHLPDTSELLQELLKHMPDKNN